MTATNKPEGKLESKPEVCHAGPSRNPLTASRFGALGPRSLWIIAITTLAAVLILLSTGRIRLSQSGESIVGSMVYCACIGLPSIFLLTRAAALYADRFPRAILFIQAMLLIVTSTLGSFTASGILVLAGAVPRAAYWNELHESLPFSVVVSLIFGLSISTFETMRYRLQNATIQLRTRQVEQERANKLLAEARLSSLESRIHPHFLFNTLNSIAALIPSDPQRAEQTVGNLASLLRFSLNAHHHGLVPLAQEIKIVRDYLEIEKTRFGARLRYEIDIPDALKSVTVPPLALQSLAENAVKHVVGPRPDGASMRIAGSLRDGVVALEVEDDGPGFSLDKIAPDHGLGNLIDRIELLYGAAGRLEVLRQDGRTVVRLSVPATLPTPAEARA